MIGDARAFFKAFKGIAVFYDLYAYEHASTANLGDVWVLTEFPAGARGYVGP